MLIIHYHSINKNGLDVWQGSEFASACTFIQYSTQGDFIHLFIFQPQHIQIQHRNNYFKLFESLNMKLTI